VVGKEEHMSAELAELTVGDEFTSTFDMAMQRMDEVSKIKSEKGKYRATVL